LQLTHPAAGAPLLEEAVALLEPSGEQTGRAQFLLHLGTIEIAAARFAAAHERYALAHRLAVAGGDQLTRLWAIFFQGVVALYMGEIAAAEQHLSACLDAWRGQGFTRGIASALNWLSEVYRHSGRQAAARACAREGLQISSTAHDMPGIARSLRELGALALDRRDLGEAQYLLTESCATFRSMGSPWVYGRSRSLLVRLEVLLGDHAAAQQGCAELLRQIRGGVPIMLPEACYGLALLLRAQGNSQEALAALYALNAAPGEHATLALAGQLRAELEQRLEPAQRAVARQQAHDRPLLAWLEELCARPLASAEAAALVASAAGRLIVPPGGCYVAESGEVLSPREVEVLRLLARGVGNAAIAERLIISTHTVKRHVSNILQKLRAASRSEAAARAQALGILG
jgi:ATP/maltotriose-dependent transcriptional regulator MalT